MLLSSDVLSVPILPPPPFFQNTNPLEPEEPALKEPAPKETNPSQPPNGNGPTPGENNPPSKPPKAVAPPPDPPQVLPTTSSSIATTAFVIGNSNLPASSATLEFASILSTSTPNTSPQTTLATVFSSTSRPLISPSISTLISTQTLISTSKKPSISTIFITQTTTTIPTPTGISGAEISFPASNQSTQSQTSSNQEIPKLVISLGAVAAALIIILLGIIIYIFRLRKQRKHLLAASTLPSFHEKDGTPQELSSKTPPTNPEIPTSYYRPAAPQELSTPQTQHLDIAYPGWAQFQKFRHNTNNPITNSSRIIRGQSKWPVLFDGSATPGNPQFQDPVFLDARAMSEEAGVPPPKYSKYKVINRYRTQEQERTEDVEVYPEEKSREEVDRDTRYNYTMQSQASEVPGDNFGLQRLTLLRARERIGKWRDVVVNTPQEIEDEVTLVDEPVVGGRVDLRKERQRFVEERRDREEIDDRHRPVSAVDSVRDMGTEVSLVSNTSFGTKELNRCLASVDDLFI